MTTTAPAITNTTACRPINTANRLFGAAESEVNNGRSVGAGRGAGGVKRDPADSVGRFAAINCGVAAGRTIAGVTVGCTLVGVTVGLGVAVAVGCGVSVAGGVGVTAGCPVAVGLGAEVSVGAGILVAVALGVGEIAGVAACVDVAVGEAVGVDALRSDVLNVRENFEPRFKSSRYSTVMVCKPGLSDN